MTAVVLVWSPNEFSNQVKLSYKNLRNDGSFCATLAETRHLSIFQRSEGLRNSVEQHWRETMTGRSWHVERPISNDKSA